MNTVTLPIIVVAALLDSINPCAISVLLISLGFVAGLGYSQKSIRLIGVAYVGGAYLGYLFIGLGILRALTLFGTTNVLTRIAALLFIIWGILEILKIKFPALNIFKIPRFSHGFLAKFMQKGSIPASFMTGVLVSLFEFPCTGGPYFSILALLREQETLTQGIGYLIVYNLIFVLPLIAIVLIGGNQSLVNAVQNWKKKNTKIFSIIVGIIFIILGIVLFRFV